MRLATELVVGLILKKILQTMSSNNMGVPSSARCAFRLSESIFFFFRLSFMGVMNILIRIAHRVKFESYI